MNDSRQVSPEGAGEERHFRHRLAYMLRRTAQHRALRRRRGWLAVGAIALALVAVLWLLRGRVAEEFAPLGEQPPCAELPTLGAYALYFGDEADPELVREVRYLARTGDLEQDLRTVLGALVAGSRGGGRSPWPPETTVQDLFLAGDGTLYVNFGESVRWLTPPGDHVEWLLAATLTRTVCANFPAVQGVRILLGGESNGRLIRRLPLERTFTAGMFKAGA